jgi:DNA-directed RNA polymerase subunit alpha
VIQKNWQELIKPLKLNVDGFQGDRRRSRIVAEPLERGFGLTLGNALRRIMLSSLQGAAVTGVQIEGVQHEFSSIPGVMEDVTEIIMNLKTLSIKKHSDMPKKLLNLRLIPILKFWIQIWLSVPWIRMQKFPLK